MTFDSTYSGKKYALVDGQEFTYHSDGYFKYVDAYVGAERTGGVAYVVLTGWVVLSKMGNMMYQTTSGTWINMTHGWEFVTTVLVSANKAQEYVDKIVKCNKQIIQNNLLCARFSYRMTDAQKKQLYDLQTRLMVRNESLMQGGLVTSIETSYPQGYVYLESYLNSFMAAGGVGVLAATTIVIACVVIASLSTAAYFAYKYFATEAEQDVKYSDDLTKVLVSKLSDEEYKQLLSETKGIVTKTKLTSKFGSYGKVLAFVLAAVGGAFLYRRVKQ